MAIAFRSHTTGQHDGNVAATTHSVTLNKPSGLATGDCLVVTISGGEDDGTARTLSQAPTFDGFTLVNQSSLHSAAESRRKWVYRKAITDGPGEPASYTFTATGSGANKLNLVGIAAAFSGVDTSAPVDVSSTFDGDTTSTTLTFNGVTTTVANTMLVMCGAARRGTPTATFNDGTEIAESAQAGTAAAGGGTTAYMGYLAQAGAGASGNKSATLTESRENDGLIVALKEAPAGGLSITSVDTDNAVLASQSQATFAGAGLASTAKFAVKRGSAIAYATDISLSGSTGGSFTAPTMTAMFSAGVRFGDVAFYAAETSGTAIASISGSITTATNWKYVNVTDLSATGSMGSLFYGNAVSLSDQVAYSSVTTRFRWPVTVSGDGYFTVNSSGSQAGDEFAYRIWDETDSTWGTEGTIEVNGGISSAEQVYAAGSLVQVSLESSTLEGATLQ